MDVYCVCMCVCKWVGYLFVDLCCEKMSQSYVIEDKDSWMELMIHKRRITQTEFSVLQVTNNTHVTNKQHAS